MSTVSNPLYVIRPGVLGDAPALARLLATLSHPTTSDSIRQVWDEWTQAGNWCYVAAHEEEGVVGVITLHRRVMLDQRKPIGRITALVVEESWRGCGIGRALVATAEKAFREAGCGTIEVTSNTQLTVAHLFYKHIGFERTSFRFAKPIS